jgi:hypothetical protein
MSAPGDINALIDKYAVDTMMSRAELTAVSREYPDEDMVRFMFETKARHPWISWPWLAYAYREAPNITLAAEGSADA